MTIVSGLADSTTLGIRRGKLTVTGADLKGVFKPVIDVSSVTGTPHGKFD